MYKIAAILAVFTCLATSAYAAGGINEAIGGQSENAETQHNDVTMPANANASAYVKAHHRHSRFDNNQ